MKKGDKKLILFGGGKIGERTYHKYKSDYDIVAVIDNNIMKFSERSCFNDAVKVISLDEYKKNYDGIKIMITTMSVEEVRYQLIKNKIYDSILSPLIFSDENVVTDYDIMHGKWPEYLQRLCDKSGKDILEIGSRIVTGGCYRTLFKKANYVGFDLYSGENVDVVGDIHELSSYFDQRFDLIFSSAVFEHLAMPWKAAIEIVKLLKPGGYVFIETHYSYASHERPWHFFQFSENSLDILFPEKFGMKCLKKGCCNLIEGKFSLDASEYLQGQLVSGLYCHSEYLGQKVREVENHKLDWTNVALNDVRKGTTYPRKMT